MQGRYNLYLDRELVATHKNIITTQGKARIRQLLAGQTTSFASSISVGIGEELPTVNDDRLTFAIEGTNILATMVDDINNRIYFRASLPVEKQYIIYELGCYSGDGGSVSGDGSLMLTFGDSTQWTDVVGTHTLADTYTRLGAKSIHYAILANETAKGSVPFVASLSQLSMDTVFSLAYYASNLESVKVRLKSTDTDYWEVTGLTSLNNDYNIVTFTKGSFVAVGAPSWDNIVTFEIEVLAGTADGFIDLDAIRYDSIGNTTLLSKALAGEPTIKPAGSTLDIEYVLEGLV